MRRESLASLQSDRSVDADAWCKRVLNQQVKSDSLDDVDANDTMTITMKT